MDRIRCCSRLDLHELEQTSVDNCAKMDTDAMWLSEHLCYLELQMQRLDTDHGRFYVVDGEYFPSVTTVLDVISRPPQLLDWAVRECCNYVRANLAAGEPITDELVGGVLLKGSVRHVEIKEQAAQDGTLLHALVQEYLLGSRRTAPRGDEVRLWRRYSAWRSWWQQQRLLPVEVEKTVISKDHRYGGTLDCLALDPDSALMLLDWKFTSRISCLYLLQAVAYKQACVEMGIPGVAGADIQIIRIGRDARPEVLLCLAAEHASLFEVFLAVRRVYDWLSPHRVGQPPRCEAATA